MLHHTHKRMPKPGKLCVHTTHTQTHTFKTSVFLYIRISTDTHKNTPDWKQRKRNRRQNKHLHKEEAKAKPGDTFEQRTHTNTLADAARKASKKPTDDSRFPHNYCRERDITNIVTPQTKLDHAQTDDITLEPTLEANYNPAIVGGSQQQEAHCNVLLRFAPWSESKLSDSLSYVRQIIILYQVYTSYMLTCVRARYFFCCCCLVNVAHCCFSDLISHNASSTWHENSPNSYFPDFIPPVGVFYSNMLALHPDPTLTNILCMNLLVLSASLCTFPASCRIHAKVLWSCFCGSHLSACFRSQKVVCMEIRWMNSLKILMQLQTAFSAI